MEFAGEFGWFYSEAREEIQIPTADITSPGSNGMSHST